MKSFNLNYKGVVDLIILRIFMKIKKKLKLCSSTLNSTHCVTISQKPNSNPLDDENVIIDTANAQTKLIFSIIEKLIKMLLTLQHLVKN